METFGLFGATKKSEYWRTIDMLMEKTGRTRKEIMFILYFLYDSQYDNEDLKNMAELIKKYREDTHATD